MWCIQSLPAPQSSTAVKSLLLSLLTSCRHLCPNKLSRPWCFSAHLYSSVTFLSRSKNAANFLIWISTSQSIRHCISSGDSRSYFPREQSGGKLHLCGWASESSLSNASSIFREMTVRRTRNSDVHVRSLQSKILVHRCRHRRRHFKAWSGATSFVGWKDLTSRSSRILRAPWMHWHEVFELLIAGELGIHDSSDLV